MSTATPRPTGSTAFAAFDDLQDSHTALEGEVAILSGLLDHGVALDPAIAFAVERHLKAETETLGAAIEKAWEIVAARGGLDDGHGEALGIGRPIPPAEPQPVGTEPGNAPPPLNFSPSAFAEQVVEAVLPLVDQEKRTQLATGYGAEHVHRALTPLFGHFTVADAVFMFDFFVGPQEAMPGAAEDGGDCPRRHAMYEARSILADFACSAKSSSPQCVAARVTMLDQGDEISDRNDEDLRTISIPDDVRRLERKNFNDAERFGSEDWLRVFGYRHSRGGRGGAIVSAEAPVPTGTADAPAEAAGEDQ